MQAQYDDYKRYGDQILPDEKKSGKDKADKAKSNARKKLAKGIEDEKLLAQKIEELIPLIEKEEAVGVMTGPSRWGNDKLTWDVAGPTSQTADRAGDGIGPTSRIQSYENEKIDQEDQLQLQ